MVNQWNTTKGREREKKEMMSISRIEAVVGDLYEVCGKGEGVVVLFPPESYPVNLGGGEVFVLLEVDVVNHTHSSEHKAVTFTNWKVAVTKSGTVGWIIEPVGEGGEPFVRRLLPLRPSSMEEQLGGGEGTR